MFHLFVARSKAAITVILILVMVLPFSSTSWAEVSEADTQIVAETPTEVIPTLMETQSEVPVPVVTAAAAPPPPVETQPETAIPVETSTEAPPPPAETPTETPAQVATLPAETATGEVPSTEAQVAPTVTMAPAEPAVVETPSTDPEALESGTHTSEAQESTPTATTDITAPDEIEVAGESTLIMSEGEYRDITVRYILGSDRASTELTVELTAPGGEWLEGWTIAPLSLADMLEDPNDPNRAYKARVDITEVNTNGDMVDTTWRIAAPDHIETPLGLRLSFASTIREPVGESTPVFAPNLVSVSTLASVHAPTLTCIAADPISWNCTFDSTHSGDMLIEVAASAPMGWEIELGGAPLSLEPFALDDATVAAESFPLAADYPIGCPDEGLPAIATLSVVFTYPSGEVITQTLELPLVFAEPVPVLEVTSFEFGDINLLESLTTTGQLTLSLDYGKCAWQATIQLGDLRTDAYTIPGVLFSVVSLEGLPHATFTMLDNLIVIHSPETTTEDGSGVITINLLITLPHQIPPGVYATGVTTHIFWKDEM